MQFELSTKGNQDNLVCSNHNEKLANICEQHFRMANTQDTLTPTGGL